MIVVGSVSANAEEETIATFTASEYNSGTTGGWTVSNADYATAGGGYYKLITSDASIVTPSINWSDYSDITITISARKFGGPDATQGKISVSQGETELASYSPSGTSIAASSALEISPADGTITISCPGASSSKGCGVGSIVIKGIPKGTPTEGIAINETNFPDDVFRAWVAENCDKAPEGGEKDGYLDDEEIAAQVIIGINNKNIEDLKGIEYFTAATMLMCDGNKLQTLDVSKNTKLTQLICYGNKLTSLNVSKNTALTSLHCTDNQLTSLNVSNNTELGMLLCQNNQLTSLDVTNNQELTTLDCSNNLINETEMGKLVESMPTISGNPGIFYPFNQSVEDANVITTTQVNDAKAKNWNVQAWNGSTYEDYAGVEPTPETNYYYKKVTTAPSDWSGEYLIVYEEGSVALNGGLSTLDAVGNTIDVVIEDKKIAATDAVNAASFTIAKMESANLYSIKAASGKYIGVTSYSNGLTSSETAIGNSLSLDASKNVVLTVTTSGGDMTLRYNKASDQKRFRYFKSGQQAIQLYKKTVALDNQYTLVTVEDEGETETAFDGNSLTKELPASTKFYIKDNKGNKYYGTADDYGVATILAENHENVPTSATGANFYLRKANTWVFTIAELETTEGITLTVNPETAGETKYMITPSNIAESEDVFDENLQLTKVMTTDGFYLMRSDDYGLFELTAAENNVTEGATQYYIWEFSKQNPTVGFLVNKRMNTYRVDKAGTYTFTLDTENNTLTAEFISGKQYTLVADDGTEYPFEGLTLTQELTGRTEFYIKDNTGKEYYASENTEDAIISAENHENLPTYESGNNFLLKKANTWVFTLTELETAEGITLTVNPEEEGETKYMISQSREEESEDVFDENLQLTKEMDTTPFFIIRSDDYGVFELSATRRTNSEGRAIFTFTEDDNAVEFEAGKRLNMYEMSEDGTYTFTIDLTNNTVTAEKTVIDLYALVTSVTELTEGDKVIIVNTDNAKAMSTTQNTNNRGAADVTFDEDGRVMVPATTDIQVFTIEGDAEGWYFNTGSGYIYASSNSSNHLKTEAEKDKNNNAKAAITITDDGTSVVFQGTNGRNVLQYNSGSDLFSCYASASQSPVQIYRLYNENEVDLTITSAEWATYVTPVAVMFPEKVKAYIITEITDGNAVGEQITEAPAGTPVIVNGAEGIHKLLNIGKANEIQNNELQVSDGTVTGDGTIYVLAVQEDATGKVAGFAPLKEGKTLSEGKAYLQAVNAGAKINFVIDGEATDIRNIENAVDFSDGDWYNLQGVKVTNPQRGIYIHNGKKVVIK